MLSVRPAISAIKVVAMPVITCSCAAIDSVMTFARYGPTSTPNNKYPVRRGS